MVQPLAIADDVADRWRPFTSAAERARAEVLIDAVSRRVRRNWPDVDARISSGDLDLLEVGDVVAGVVKRVLISGDTEGLESRSETAGPFAWSEKYANPMGNIYFTADERAVFEGGVVATAGYIWAD